MEDLEQTAMEDLKLTGKDITPTAVKDHELTTTTSVHTCKKQPFVQKLSA